MTISFPPLTINKSPSSVSIDLPKCFDVFDHSKLQTCITSFLPGFLLTYLITPNLFVQLTGRGGTSTYPFPFQYQYLVHFLTLSAFSKDPSSPCPATIPDLCQWLIPLQTVQAHVVQYAVDTYKLWSPAKYNPSHSSLLSWNDLYLLLMAVCSPIVWK